MANLNEAKLFGASSLPNGKLLVLTTTPQTVHVAVNNTTEWDVITIDINNGAGGAGAAHEVVINWAGTDVALTVAHDTTVTAIDRWRLNSGLEIKASVVASTSNVKLYCQVDRYPAG